MGSPSEFHDDPGNLDTLGSKRQYRGRGVLGGNHSPSARAIPRPISDGPSIRNVHSMMSGVTLVSACERGVVVQTGCP